MSNFFMNVYERWNRIAHWVGEHPKSGMTIAIIVALILIYLVIRT